MADKQARRFRFPRHWTVAQRLAHHSVVSPTGCRLWTGSLTTTRYGYIHYAGRRILAHRAAWEEANGPVPLGLHVCHRCDVPTCVNPSHLFVDTLAGNMADKVSKGRQARGETHPQRILTAADVIAIRADGRQGIEIAAAYGVSAPTVCAIRLRRIWRHI